MFDSLYDAYTIPNIELCDMVCVVYDHNQLTAKAKKQDCNGKEAPLGKTGAWGLTGGPPALPTPQC